MQAQAAAAQQRARVSPTTNTAQVPAQAAPQAQAPAVKPLSAVASGKRPLVATKSAVPVVPSAPAKSVTGNTVQNPPAPPTAAPITAAPAATAKRPAATTQRSDAAHPPPAAASSAVAGSSALASTSSFSGAAAGEREKIRDFWLGLSENDRRSLVKIEKDAVLRKMKEQQRHGCTCAVCGRKRQAIEVELEVLYDAYYDELESYANHQAEYRKSGGAIPPPIGPGPFPGSVDMETVLPASVAPSAGKAQTAVRNTPQPALKQTAVKQNLQPPPASKAVAKVKDAHHTHSPSCPHYPHTHNHPHHHHHPAPPAAQNRGKGVVQPAAPEPHDHEVYTDEEDDYPDDEGDEEYEDEGTSRWLV